MSNSYYNHGSYPVTGAPGASAALRAELDLVTAGFALLPTLSGNANKALVIDSGGTAVTVTTGTLALAGNLATTGAYNTTLIQGASTSLTLPLVNGTLATLAGTETLSNKTIAASTLSGTVSGGGNQINNVIVGASTPLAGTFTTLTATTANVTGVATLATGAVLNTPASMTATNITGTAAGLTAGNVTTNANLTGDVTSVGNATTLTNAPVIAKVLTGYVSGAGTVAATDSILQAIQKLNGNDATNANLTGAITSVGNATSLGSFSSANLATALTDETGTGANVFATSPTLVTPALGTPASGIMTNVTGTAANLTAGNVTTNANLTGDVTSVGNATTLATVATAGSTGSSTAIPVITINAKGLTTSISTAAVVAPAGTLTGATLASNVLTSSLTSLGTIASLTATAGTVATTPSGNTDIANKLYVDTVAQGLDAKASCIAATTANITLSGTQTVDGVVLIATDRVLVKNQTASAENGLYLCAAGAWTRTTDADTWDELRSAFVFIEKGTLYADTGWTCTIDSGGTLGTTAVTWAQFSGAGSYTAGTGLTLTGTAFSLTSPVATTLGGTNLTSFTANGVMYASSTSALATGSALTFDGTNFATTGGIGATGATGITNTVGGNTARMIATAAGTYFGSTTAADVIFQQNSTEGMRLTSTGLGIGTSSPTSKLSVNALRTTSSGEFLGGINSVDTTTGGAAGVGGVVTLSGDTQGAGLKQFAAVLGGKENSTLTDYAGYLGFYTRLGGGSLTERARIDSSGNLGLGVTPSAWNSGYRFMQFSDVTGAFVGGSGYALQAGANAYINSGGSWIYGGGAYGASRYSQFDGAHTWYKAPSGTAGTAITFTQAMTLDASGNLGIGTSSPTGRLEASAANCIVYSTGTGGYGSFYARGSGTNSSYIFMGNATSGEQARLTCINGGDLTFSNTASVTERMRLDSSGNLGIGTSSPTSKLTVSSTASTYAVDITSTNTSINNRALNVYNSAATGTTALTNHIVRLASNGSGADCTLQMTDSVANNGYIGMKSGALNFGANTTTTQMTLDTSGNLGLGVTPSGWGSGVKVVQVSNYAAVSSSGAYGGSYSSNSYYDGTNWKYITTDSATKYDQVSGKHTWYNAPSGTAGNAITFTQAMTLDATGHLGIGAAPPSGVPLYVSNSGAYAWLNTTTSGYSNVTGFDNGVQRWAVGQSAFGGANGMQFFSGTAESMRLDSSGNLLVGTTSTLANGKMSVYNSSTGNGIDARIVGSGTAYSVYTARVDNTANLLHTFFYGNYSTVVGSITTNGTITAYNTTSDYRLKEFVAPVTNAGERIDALNPVEFDWKSDGSRARGFFAHEFQQVYASSVNGTKDAVDEDGKPVYQAMQASTAEVIADLVAEIKSLRVRLNALENK